MPGQISLICPAEAVGIDGMPLVFSVQIEQSSVSPEAFAIEMEDGTRVTPVCATLAPAFELLEQRTVLLAADFGTDHGAPVAVEVVGALNDLLGNSLQGLRRADIVPLSAGPSLVLAERFAPDTEGLAGECPEETKQVVQLTWNGGVHGIGHTPLGEAQALGTTVTLEAGTSVKPIALADDDPDNHVLACLDSDERALSVTIAAGLFEDPGEDPNSETTIKVAP